VSDGPHRARGAAERSPEAATDAGPLTEEQLRDIDAWWRAAN
jgi:hypothetical protein